MFKISTSAAVALSLSLGATLASARFMQVFNASHPLRLAKLDCDSSPGNLALDGRLCSAICEQECNMYHTLPEIASCLAVRGALSCMYEYDEAYISEGDYCIGGTNMVVISLEDPYLKRHLNHVQEVHAWVEAEIDMSDYASVHYCRTGQTVDIEIMELVKNPVVKNRLSSHCGGDNWFQVESRLLGSVVYGELTRHDKFNITTVDMTNFVIHNRPYFNTPMYLQLEVNPCILKPVDDYKRRAGMIIFARQPLADMVQFLPTGASADH